MLEGYFALSGRIRRWRFFLYSLVLWVIVPVLVLLSVPLVDHARHPLVAQVVLTIAIGAFWVWAGIALVVKRLHDLNRSGWHYLWMFFLPGVLTGGFWFYWRQVSGGSWSIGYGQVSGTVPVLATLYLIFASGSDGPNDYGYPP